MAPDPSPPRSLAGRAPLVEVNAVFKGGGAKGIAYVGAVEVCEQRGIRFRAVAGSSAGAISAALIAAGYQAPALAKLLPEVLSTMDSPWRALFALHRRSLLRGAPLEAWLDRTLAKSVATVDRVTFEELRAASGVSLYVVAMDAHRRQPVVFSPDITPTMPVAAAVTASAAIPVAFPAHRVSANGGVIRLIDGGVWANYPHFVFLDAEFREVHQLADGAADRPTIGFSLESDAAESARRASIEPLARQRPRDADGGSAARRLGAGGALLSSRWAKGLAVAMPLLAGVSVLCALWWIGHRDWERLESLPVLVQPVVLVVLLLALAGAVVVTAVVGFVTARFARSALDEGLSGLSAAMGVGPSVPYWLGGLDSVPGRDDHAVIRIPVPASIGTLSFRAKQRAIEQAVSAGRAAAISAFDSPQALSNPADASAVFGVKDEVIGEDRANAVVKWFLFGFVKAITFGAIAIVAIRRASDGRLSVVVPLAAIGFGALWSVRTYALRRHARATGKRASLRSLGVGANLTVALAAGSFAGLVLGASEFGSTQTILASVGEPAVELQIYREDAPLLRVLQAGSVEGVVLENEVVDGQRRVVVDFADWSEPSCAAPAQTVEFPVGSFIGLGSGEGRTFSVPFEVETCTMIWSETGREPNVVIGLFSTLLAMALAAIAVNALLAAGLCAVDRWERRRR